MAGETVITVVGNLTGDPELKFTQNGAAVTSFTVASTPRTFDRQSNEWKDGDALFLRCSMWREAAENATESLRKGMRVIVQGALVQRNYQTKEGENRTSYEMQVHEVGPSLKYATAQVQRRQQGQPAQQAQGWDQSQNSWGQPATQQGFQQAAMQPQQPQQTRTSPPEQVQHLRDQVQQAQQSWPQTAQPGFADEPPF